MVGKSYIPEQGDIILIDLNPQSGSEMAKRRPCLVLTKKILNQKNGRVLVCPITSTPPITRLHIPLPIDQIKVSGTLVLDQIRTLDFKGLNAQKIDKLFDLELYDEIVDTIGVMIAR